jgi:hypothetical protein
MHFVAVSPASQTNNALCLHHCSLLDCHRVRGVENGYLRPDTGMFKQKLVELSTGTTLTAKCKGEGSAGSRLSAAV